MTLTAVIERLQKFGRRYLSSGRRVSPQQLKHMADSLLDDAEPNSSYKVLTLGSCIIATLGLLSNSTAVIIGAMLIAPLMLPIRGLSFGILEADKKLIRTGLKAIALGTVGAIAVSMLLGRFVNLSDYGSEVWGRTQPTLLDLGIAITAGALAGFAKIEAKLSSSLAGTAIAVALMPPLCVVGLWLAEFQFQMAWGAMVLYLTNLLGITLACMGVFLWAGYSPVNRARRPIGLTIALTSLLLIPLGVTSYRLILQDRLEANLRVALLNRTLTFQRVRLIALETDWPSRPPVVTLTVYADNPVTPRQVELLEEFVEREMGRPFTLVFEVGYLDEVTSTSPPGQSMGDLSRPREEGPWNQN
ncbi:MAG: DUF389 domain-containing protein [Cyanobacteria bacterium P01_C01_bin.120]